MVCDMKWMFERDDFSEFLFIRINLESCNVTETGAGSQHSATAAVSGVVKPVSETWHHPANIAG